MAARPIWRSFSTAASGTTAVLPIGGQNLTKDLAIGLLTSQTDAEKIKVQHGIARTELVHGHQIWKFRPWAIARRDNLRAGISPRFLSRASKRCSSLSEREIVRAGYEGMLGAGVVITGGTSLLEGMPDAAEEG